ncbi:MAG: EamA family transporter [Alphaproteobacteria bacterium]
MSTPPSRSAASRTVATSYASAAGNARAGRAAPGQALCTAVLFGLGLLWGLQIVLLRMLATAGVDETGALAPALTLCAAAFAAVLAARGGLFRPTRSEAAYFVLAALFGFVVPLGGAAAAASAMPAGVVAFFESLTPVATVAILLALRWERVGRDRLFGVALGTVGVAVLLLREFGRPESGWLHALPFAVAIPAAYAFDGIYVARFWPRRLNTLQVVTGQLAAAALIALPAWFVVGTPSALFADWPAVRTPLAAFIGVTGVEIYLYILLLRLSGSMFVAFGSFIALPAGIAWGMALLDEWYPPHFWLAVALSLAALALIALPRQPARKPARRRP